MKKRLHFLFGIVRMSIMIFLVLGSIALSTQQAGATSLDQTASIGGCPLFPANNIWNYDISHLPASPNSSRYVTSIGLGAHLHPDFGAGLYAGAPIGFPFVVVPGSQPTVPVSFTYATESDPGPYPVPANVPIEGGAQSTGDRHVLVVDSGNCKLYEMFSSYQQANGIWHAGSGAVWSLNSNTLRPATWTSADAAGLPILPGLVTYNEVASGVINHALRFTVNQTQDTFLWPARHAASASHDTALPPMGLRLRLKASVNISSFSRSNQIILTALKRYGMFVADNGSSWFLSGSADNRWNNDDLHALSAIPGSDFEAVDESSQQVSANSGQASGAPAAPTSPTSPKTAAPPRHAPTITFSSNEADVPQTKLHIRHSAAPAHSPQNEAQTMPMLVLGAGTLILCGVGAALMLKQRKKARSVR